MSTPARARQQAFDRVLNELGSAIWRLTAGYAADDASRQDLYQDILVAIWESLSGFRGDSSLRTYVYRIAHNRGLSYRTYESRRQHTPLDSVVVVAAGSDPTEKAEGARRRDVLHAAIRELSPALRQAIMLHLDDLSNSEIAQIMDISEGNVAVRLTRARKAVERHIKEREAS